MGCKKAKPWERKGQTGPSLPLRELTVTPGGR